MTKHYHVTSIKQVNQLFLQQWQQLWQEAENANICNSPDWFVMAMEEEHKEYEIFACYKAGHLVAVAPFFNNTCYGVPVLSPPQDTFVVNTPFLIERYDVELLKEFFNVLKLKHLYIPNIDAKEVSILHQVFPELFFSLISVNPYITLDADPFRFLSKSNRKEIKRLIRNNQTDLRFNVYGHQDDVESCLEKMFAIDQASGKKLRSRDIFSEKKNQAVYRNLVQQCGRFVKICFVYYKDIPIAYIFGFMHNKTFIDYQTSYLHEYRRLSPGKLVIYFLLEWLAEAQFEFFDFCGGVSDYKMRFAQDYYIQYSLYHSPNRGIQWWWMVINTARRIKQLTAPERFTRDHEFLFKTLP